jgi:hypothetical protein
VGNTLNDVHMPWTTLWRTIGSGRDHGPDLRFRRSHGVDRRKSAQ